MKTLNHTYIATLLGLFMVSLAACHSSSEPDTVVQKDRHAAKYGADHYERKSVPAPVICNNCGTITNIEQEKEKGSGSGLGAVVGAVAGAVVGHQVGDGRGKDLATAAGAIGGGFAGNEIEKRAKGTTYFHVTVAMENGGTQTVDVPALNGLTTGSKVKVIGNSLQFAS